MTAYLDDLFAHHLGHVLEQEPVPDDAEEMNWRLFLAHSQDMQGFAADIFIGGPQERRHPSDSSYRPLRERWGKDSQSLLADLAAVWAMPDAKAALERFTVPTRRGGSASEGIATLYESGRVGAREFAETLEELTGSMVARKTNKMIRAYVQNAGLLARHDFSFRAYLQAGAADFPPISSSPFEALTRSRIERDFYNVGPALANYLISDWLLWLWKEGRIAWFESYKADTVHQASVDRGLLPAAAGEDFVAFCRTIRIPPGFGAASGQLCPPRVLNACLWQDGNLSSGAPRNIPRAASASRLAHNREHQVAMNRGHVSGGLATFRDDDDGYRQWLLSHPEGFVLNVERSPSARYLKLHRPACDHITRPIRNRQQLTRDYIKICASTRAAIGEWCLAHLGVGPQTSCYCVA